VTPRGWAWLAAVGMALLVGGVFTVRFLRKPQRTEMTQRPAPPQAPSLLDLAMGMDEAQAQAEARGLSGRVVDGEDRPVAGARVFLAEAARGRPPLMSCAGPGPSRCARGLDEVPLSTLLAALHAGTVQGEADDATATDADGVFSFPPRDDGPWVVWVDEAAGAVGEALADAAAGAERILVVHPHTRVAGEVVDEADAPVPGAHVHLVSDLPRHVATAATGPDGHFQVEGPGEDVVVLVDAPGFAPRRAGALGEDMRVVLQREARCRVHVTRAGRPVSARVRVQVETEEWPEELREAPGGALELGGLPASARLLLVAEDDSGRSAPRSVVALQERCDVTLALEPTADVVLQDEATRDAEVRVQGHGVPVPGAAVRLEPLGSQRAGPREAVDAGAPRPP